MEDSRVFKVPANAPKPAELADAWSRVVANAFELVSASATRALDPHVPLPYDPAAPARALGAFAAHLMANPAEIFKAQQEAAADWMKLWSAAAARATGAAPDPLIEPERGDAAGAKAEVEWIIPRPVHDTYLVAIATGPAVTAPFWAMTRPYQPTSTKWKGRAIGSTNPVWLDADGDGRFTPGKK